MYKWCEFWG